MAFAMIPRRPRTTMVGEKLVIKTLHTPTYLVEFEKREDNGIIIEHYPLFPLF